jgi:hypothetical protein
MMMSMSTLIRHCALGVEPQLLPTLHDYDQQLADEFAAATSSFSTMVYAIV